MLPGTVVCIMRQCSIPINITVFFSAQTLIRKKTGGGGEHDILGTRALAQHQSNKNVARKPAKANQATHIDAHVTAVHKHYFRHLYVLFSLGTYISDAR